MSKTRRVAGGGEGAGPRGPWGKHRRHGHGGVLGEFPIVRSCRHSGEWLRSTKTQLFVAPQDANIVFYRVFTCFVARSRSEIRKHGFGWLRSTQTPCVSACV